MEFPEFGAFLANNAIALPLPLRGGAFGRLFKRAKREFLQHGSEVQRSRVVDGKAVGRMWFRPSWGREYQIVLETAQSAFTNVGSWVWARRGNARGSVVSCAGVTPAGAAAGRSSVVVVESASSVRLDVCDANSIGPMLSRYFPQLPAVKLDATLVDAAVAREVFRLRQGGSKQWRLHETLQRSGMSVATFNLLDEVMAEATASGEVQAWSAARPTVIERGAQWWECPGGGVVSLVADRAREQWCGYSPAVLASAIYRTHKAAIDGVWPALGTAPAGGLVNGGQSSVEAWREAHNRRMSFPPRPVRRG